MKATTSTSRIFLGFRETAGYFAGLREGFGELNIPVTQVDLSDDPLGYGRSPGRLQRLIRLVARRRSSTKGPARGLWLIVQGILTACVLGAAIPRHDVFILGAHNRAFVTIVYPLLRLTGKRIITVFLGSSVRPPYINVKSVGTSGAIDGRRLRNETVKAIAQLRAAERWSHHVINHPPSAQFATRPFVDFLTIGIPFQAPPIAQPRSRATGVAVRILHAPSDKAAKGTSIIRAAVDEVRSGNVPLEYTEISGRPHGEVLEEIAVSQLVVDQAYSDQPMPGFATEAAAHGVPVVIGSEDWEGANHGLQPEAIPPTVQIHPRDLAGAIRELALDADRRAESGRLGAEFVRTRWSPAAVAERFLTLVNDEVPAEWMRSPSDVRYVHGVGLPESRMVEAVATLVGSFGVEALGLDHNPPLRDRLLELAKTHKARQERAV